LSAKSTVEERTSPEGLKNFEVFMASLGARTPQTFKALHVLVGQQFYSPDLDVTADSLEELIANCRRKLDLLPPTDPIPSADRAAWWRFWCADFAGSGAAAFPECRLGKALLVFRGDARPEFRGGLFVV